jgi:hypothetical protein
MGLASSLHPVLAELEPGHECRTAQGDQRDLEGDARLEAHTRPRRYIESVTRSRLPVEGEGGVHVGEMEVRTDLYRSISDVLHSQGQQGPTGVQLDLTRRRHDGARRITVGHGIGW